MQPLEIVHRLKDQSHKQHERSRLDSELKWIKQLQTVYPLGLNDNVMGVGNVSKLTNINIMEISSKKSRNNRPHGRRINRNKRKFHRVFVSLSDLLNIFKNNGRHKLLCKLSTIPAQRLHNIYTDCLTISHTSPKYELSLIISAFALNKLFPRPNKPENVKRHFLKLPFINKGIDIIDLPSILRDFNVNQTIPPCFDNKEPPIISYSYKKPTRGIIFNYTSISTDTDILNNCPTSCDCNESKFRYEPCGHVITGDLKIVEDREVINVLRKGPKYRPPSKINWTDCRNTIEKALIAYCKRWCKREHEPEKVLDEFRKKCMSIVDIRIKHHEANYICSNPRMPVTRIKQKLKQLGEKFVFVPADKAANNVVIV